MTYKLLISYDGKNYNGWQRLDSKPTIQGKIEDVLSRLYGHNITVDASGRTDRGVHAKMQVASFKAKGKTAVEIKEYLVRYLPRDISVYDVTEASEDFHARYKAKSKIYEYVINFEVRDPFLRNYSMFLNEKPDILKMKKAAEVFLGTHDFKSFANAKSKKKSSVRTIYDISFEENKNILKIAIHADGFLYNMARKMVGALIECGRGTADEMTIENMLSGGGRNMINVLAPPEGLFLKEVFYDI